MEFIDDGDKIYIEGEPESFLVLSTELLKLAQSKDLGGVVVAGDLVSFSTANGDNTYFYKLGKQYRAGEYGEYVRCERVTT